MVAQITEGTAFDRHGRPFRRRNARPAIYALVVLLVATAVAWTIALTRPSEVREAVVC
ncbi:MAG: envelope integrity protein Cei, partial [Mycobacterium sp.]